MNKDLIPKFDTPSILSKDELTFLSNNSQKIDEDIKDSLIQNQDILFNIEKEIGAFLIRSRSLVQKKSIYGYYSGIINILKQSNPSIQLKSREELIRMSKYPRMLKSYTGDKEIDKKINEIIFKWGKNSIGEYLGDETSLGNIQDRYNSFGDSNYINILQNSLGVEMTGKIDEKTLIAIVKFQIQSGCKYIDGLIGNKGESMNKLKQLGKYNENLKQESTRQPNFDDKLKEKAQTKLSLDFKINFDKQKSLEENVSIAVEEIIKYHSKIQIPSVDGQKQFKDVGEIQALKLIEKKYLDSIGEEGIFALQKVFGIVGNGKLDKQLLSAVVKFQYEKLGLEKADGLALKNTKTLNEIIKLENFPKQAGIELQKQKQAEFESKLQINTILQEEVDSNFDRLVGKNRNIQRFKKRHERFLTHKDNPFGIKELQALLGINPTGEFDEITLKEVIKLQLERKIITGKGNIDGLIADDGETMIYLKEKNGNKLKKIWLENGMKNNGFKGIVESVKKKTNEDLSVEQIQNFINNIPGELLIDMIFEHGSLRWEDFKIFEGNLYSQQVGNILEDNIVLVLTNFGLDIQEVSSYKAQRSKSGTTLCARTARMNLFNTFGVDYSTDLQGSSAQSIKNKLENNGLITNHFGVKSALDQMNQMADNLQGNVFDVFFDKYKDAVGKKRKITGNEKYGHRVVAFKGIDGEIRVLDPYVKPKILYLGRKSQEPYLFKDHPFVDKFSIGISKNVYYSKDVSHYKLEFGMDTKNS